MAELVIRKEDLAELIKAIAQLYPSAEDFDVILRARLHELQLYKELFLDLLALNYGVLKPNGVFRLHRTRKQRLLEVYSIAFESLVLFKELNRNILPSQRQEMVIWNLLRFLLHNSSSHEEDGHETRL